MMEIDWGNPGFIRLYGLVFALAAVFTMVQWLISVVKRVVRGAPIAQAAMENVGYLLMSVAVAAFMPLAVAYTVDFIDSAAAKILDDYLAQLFVGGTLVFNAMGALLLLLPGVGVVIAIPIGFMILLAVFGLWVMLVVRNALILLGLIFGPLVFAGLVDKDLWGHTRKWVGIMGGIIASKLCIYLALALAGALLGGVGDSLDRITLPQAIGTCLTFMALLFIALFMPFQIAKWLPFVGDEIQAMAHVKDEAGQRAKAAKAKQDDMKAKAASKKAGGGGGGGGTGAAMGMAAKAAPPVAIASAVKEVGDQVRDQAIQAAKDGANNASGDGGGGGQQGGGQQGGSGRGKGPGGLGGSPRGGGRGGSGGGGGGGGARRPAPAPPPRSSAPSSKPGGAPRPPARQGGGAPTSPARQGGGAPPPPAPAPPPPPRPARQGGGAPPPPAPAPPPPPRPARQGGGPPPPPVPAIPPPPPPTPAPPPPPPAS